MYVVEVRWLPDSMFSVHSLSTLLLLLDLFTAILGHGS